MTTTGHVVLRQGPPPAQAAAGNRQMCMGHGHGHGGHMCFCVCVSPARAHNALNTPPPPQYKHTQTMYPPITGGRAVGEVQRLGVARSHARDHRVGAKKNLRIQIIVHDIQTLSQPHPKTQPNQPLKNKAYVRKHKPNKTQVWRHRPGLRAAGQGLWDEDPGAQAPPPR